MIVTMMLAAADAAPQKTVLDGVISVGGIIILVGLVGSVLTILRAMRTTKRENQLDAQDREDRLMAKIDKHNGTVEDRLKEVEVTIRDFMPRTEIEKAFEHEKNNRVAGQNGLAEAQRDQARTLGDIQREQARFGALLEASNSAVTKVEAAVEKLAGHMNDRLDKISDCVTSISRKVS